MGIQDIATDVWELKKAVRELRSDATKDDHDPAAKYFAVYGASLAIQAHQHLTQLGKLPTDDELHDMRNVADKIAHQDRIITKWMA